MKKLRIIMIAALCVVAAFGFAACKSSAIVGTYVYSTNESGMSIEMEIELKSDDSFVMTAEMSMELAGETMSEVMKTTGTYTVDGDKVTLTPTSIMIGEDFDSLEADPEGDLTEQIVTVKDGKLTMTEYDDELETDVTMVFTKK